MTPFNTTLIILVTIFSGELQAQNSSVAKYRFLPTAYELQQTRIDSIEKNGFPNPKKVFRRSLIIPGWGQVMNKQIWKVPIVYGLIGGLTYYSIDLTKKYHDYRAAYYNLVKDDPNDLRFGPTPDYLAGSTNTNALRSNRDFLRNRRDFIYITIGLAWLLNGVDAYVFAHLRSFDVSDDLSMNGTLRPGIIQSPYFGEVPSVSVTLNLIH